jgi:hypothetical protein
VNEPISLAISTANLNWRRLCAATLLSAVECLQRSLLGKSRKGSQAEAIAWFATPDLDVVMKLRTVCAALSLSVARVQVVGRELAQQQFVRRRRQSRR